MREKLKIVPVDLLEAFELSIVKNQLSTRFNALTDAEISSDTFSFIPR